MAFVSTYEQLSVMAIWGSLIVCCLISGINGDVPDDVVYTDLHKTVRLGDKVILKCEFFGTPLAVYWKGGHDPTIRQNLISWFGDEPLEGSCVQDNTCGLGANYSFIIKNITIADQGRYICRVASYKGILIHNFTDIKVYALPTEPYPAINECKTYEGGECALQATDALNITCTVMNYFPNVDLFFLHGSQKYGTNDTKEWTNSDGTKSKSISTEAKPSSTPYTCVAFNIPGSQDQRTATAIVDLNDIILSNPETPGSQTEGIILVAIVPAIACVIAGIILLYVFQRRKGRRDENVQDQEAMQMIPQLKIEGKLSFYELWILVSTLHDNSTKELLPTFHALNISDIKEGFTRREAYEAMCKWKMGNQTEKGSYTLQEALGHAGAERGWKIICDIRRDTSKKVSPQILEHILWHVKDPKKLDRFIQVLTSDQSEKGKPIEYTGKTGQDVRLALGELIKWSSCDFDVNPLVLLSLAMEEAGCTTDDALLLTVPDDLQAPVNHDQVRAFVNKLTGRHCRRLDLGSKVSSCQMDDIIIQNNNHLLNSCKIISEWLRESECSNYEKRCKLDDAVIKIGRHDLTGNHNRQNYQIQLRSYVHAESVTDSV